MVYNFKIFSSFNKVDILHVPSVVSKEENVPKTESGNLSGERGYMINHCLDKIQGTCSITSIKQSDDYTGRSVRYCMSRSCDQFYIVIYDIKWVTTSWTYSMTACRIFVPRQLTILKFKSSIHPLQTF